MAQKVQVLLIDDIDGKDADETVRFGLDGIEYEIDLTTKNAQALRDALADYVAAGRRSGGRRKSGARPQSASEVAKVREWAKANGVKVSQRGRISADVYDAYKKANG